jgi:hypothetical protein
LTSATYSVTTGSGIGGRWCTCRRRASTTGVSANQVPHRHEAGGRNRYPLVRVLDQPQRRPRIPGLLARPPPPRCLARRPTPRPTTWPSDDLARPTTWPVRRRRPAGVRRILAQPQNQRLHRRGQLTNRHQQRIDPGASGAARSARQAANSASAPQLLRPRHPRIHTRSSPADTNPASRACHTST